MRSVRIFPMGGILTSLTVICIPLRASRVFLPCYNLGVNNQ
jgi:hypothetical protein